MSLSNAKFQVDGHDPSATYQYVDQSGEPVGLVARFEAGTVYKDKKTFRQHGWAGGGYTTGLNGTVLPLYGLPGVLEAIEGDRTVYVVEGEKCVEALEGLRLDATTCSGGAGSWRAHHTESLRGADVVVIPDNDDSGHAHAQQVAIALNGVAKSVRLLELPDLGSGQDIVNWIAQGNRVAELLKLLKGCAPFSLAVSTGAPPLPIPIAPPSEGEPLPVDDALPPLLGDVAREIAEAVKVDVAAPAALIPAVLSAAAGNAFCVRVSETHVEPCFSRYVLVSAKPGERKSALFKHVNDPLSTWAKEEAPRWQEAKMAAETRNAMLDKVASTARNRAKKDSDSFEEALKDAIRSEAEKQEIPRPPVVFSTDVTSPALVRRMDRNGGAHAILSGDARAVVDLVLGQHRSDRGADDAVFLQAHGGDPFDRGRVGDDEYLVIQHPSLALGICVQPDALVKLVSRDDLRNSGFVPRLNLLAPPSMVGSRIETGKERPMNRHTLASYSKGVIATLNKRFDIIDREGVFKPVELRLCPEAMDLRRKYANELERAQAPGGELEDVSGFASKAAGEAARLAALYHLHETGVEGLDPEEHREVSVECWMAAEAMQRWQLQETLRVLGLAEQSAEALKACRVLEWAAKNPKQRTTIEGRDLVSAYIVGDVSEAAKVLGYLEDRSWVTMSPPENKQRTSRWTFHPSLFQQDGEQS